MSSEAVAARVVRWHIDHPNASSTEAGAALGLHPVSVRKIMSKARRAARVPADAELHVCSCGDVHSFVPVMDLGLEGVIAPGTNCDPAGSSAHA